METWRNRPLEREYPHVFLDGIWLKRSWAGEVQHVFVLVAVGVSREGYREVLGVAEVSCEDSKSWRQFLSYLGERELERIRLVVSDKSLGGVPWLSFSHRPSGRGVCSIFIALCCMRFRGVKAKRWPWCSRRSMHRKIMKPSGKKLLM